MIPFEDQKLEAVLKEHLPGRPIRVLAKKDLTGKSLREIVRLIRQSQPDIVVASVYGSTVNRNIASLELLLALVPSRIRLIRIDEARYQKVRISRLLLLRLPHLIVGSIVGLMGLALVRLLCLLAGSVGQKASLAVGEGNSKSVLFLRTDLAGKLTAGGSVSHVKGVINGLMGEGYRIVYVADAEAEFLPSKVEQIILRPIKLLSFFDEFQLTWYNLQFLAKWPRLLRRQRPSVVYQRHAAFSICGGVIARLAGVPMVLEVNASEVWVKRNWSRLVWEGVAEACEATALSLADHVTVISEAVVEQLNGYRVAPGKIVVNPNGVDPTIFYPEVDATPVQVRHHLNAKIVAGFIGTFTRWHGVETLYEAAIEACAQRDDLRFLFIGDGELRPVLERRALEAGLGQQLIFTGLVASGLAPMHLAACDILISPHLGFEGTERFFGSPTKLFEYMAMGRAIVASRLEQIGEVIRDGENGLTMRPGDSQSLCQAVLRLAGDPSLRQRLGTRAREDVLARYTWSSHVRKILSALESGT